MAPCDDCAQTGFSDKVNRGQFTMQPKEKICATCGGRGWIASGTHSVQEPSK